MSAIEFYLGYTKICGIQEYAYCKIQMAFQSKTFPLTSPDFSNPVTLESPFNIPKGGFHGTPQAGTQGVDNLSFECNNTDLGGGVRIWDLIRGKATGYIFDTSATYVHIKLLYKKTGQANYVVRQWQTIDYTSIQAVIGYPEKPDTWVIKFNTRDSFFQLEDTTITDFVEAKLPHATKDYTANTQYLTYIGNYGTYYAGKYKLVNAKFDDGKNVYWLGQARATGGVFSPIAGDSTAAVDVIRYFNLSEILQAAHEYLGLEATTVNNGAYWSNIIPWTFLVNNGDCTNSNTANNTQLLTCNFDELYIISGVYIWDGNVAVYAHNNTFFDRTGAGFSFFNLGNPLEIVKVICNSFGMVSRIKVNSSGQRYLSCQLADIPSVSESWGNSGNWEKDIQITPYAKAINGIEVVSPTNVTKVRGSVGTGSIKIDCLFATANSIRANDPAFKNKADDGNGECVSMEPKNAAFYAALYHLRGTPTGRFYPNSYSICAIVPSNGNATVAKMKGGANPYIAKEDNTYNAEKNMGKIVTTYGGLDFTNSAMYSNVVMYPNDALPYNSWGEVLALALAHYFYSPESSANDFLGIFRSKGIGIKINRCDILDSIPYPGSSVEIILNGETFNCTVTDALELYTESKTEFNLDYWS